MRLIALAVVLGFSLSLAPLASGKVYRIGVLINLPPTGHVNRSFIP